MKLKNVIQTKLAKTLVAALMIGSISNTGFTVQAEEATQNEHQYFRIYSLTLLP